MGEKSGCRAFSRCILTILAFLHLVAGLAVIGLTLWIRLDPTFEEGMRKNILRDDNNSSEMEEVKEEIRFGLTISFWVLCGCGLAGAIIGLLGTCGAMFTSRGTLILYLLTSVLLVLIEIAIGVFIFLYKPTIEKTVTHYVDLANQLSGSTDDMKVIMSRYNCCGTLNDIPAHCKALNESTCTTAVWERLEYTLLIAAYVTIGIIVVQIISVIFGITIVASRSD